MKIPKPALTALLLSATLLGNCKKGGETVREGIAPAPQAESPHRRPDTATASGSATMENLVAALIHPRAFVKDSAYLDSLARIFPRLPKEGNVDAVEEHRFGFFESENAQTTLSLDYHRPAPGRNDSILQAQAIDCMESKTSYGQVKSRLRDRFGPPDEQGNWIVGSLQVVHSGDSTSCHAASISQLNDEANAP